MNFRKGVKNNIFLRPSFPFSPQFTPNVMQILRLPPFSLREIEGAKP